MALEPPRRLNLLLHNATFSKTLNPGNIDLVCDNTLNGLAPHAQPEAMNNITCTAQGQAVESLGKSETCTSCNQMSDPQTITVTGSSPGRADIFRLSNDEIGKHTGAHFTTVYRWRRDHKKMPETIVHLLRFLGLRELDQLGWTGWKILKGLLVSPSGQEFTQGEVEAIQIRKQQLAEYETRIRSWNATPQQPTPDESKDLVKHFRRQDRQKRKR